MPVLRFSSKDIDRSVEAIVAAYSPPSFHELLRLDLNKNLDELIGDAADYRTSVQKVILTANAHRWLFDLIAAAYIRNNHPALRSLYEEFSERASDASSNAP